MKNYKIYNPDYTRKSGLMFLTTDNTLSNNEERAIEFDSKEKAELYINNLQAEQPNNMMLENLVLSED